MNEPGFRVLFSGFSDSEEEKQYILSLQNPSELRLIILAGSLIYLLFLFLDFYLFREYFRAFLVVRAGVFTPVVGLIYLSTYTGIYQRYSKFMIAMVALTAAGGIIVMEYIARDSRYADLYFYGVALILIFFYGSGKLTTLFSILVGLAILIPTLIVDSVFVEDDLKRTITKSVFMTSMVLAGNITSAVMQKTARSSFLKQLKIEELSMTDQLTGRKNRLFFETVIRPELEDYIGGSGASSGEGHERASDKYYDCCYGLLLLDIDHFKKVNDLYGHETGDAFLKEFSRRLEGVIRTNDVFIRWGGEEFLIILRHTKYDSIHKLSGRISRAIAGTPFIHRDSEVQVTVSGGVLPVPRGSCERLVSVERMIDMADRALYHSKNSGRNRFSEFRIDGEDPSGSDDIRDIRLYGS